MKDPHVVALVYRLRHDDSVDYTHAAMRAFEEDDFTVTVEDERARFELTSPCATEREARCVVEPFISDWEFDIGLKSRNPDAFRLEFKKAEVVDASPTRRGISSASWRFTTGMATVSVRTKVQSVPYPGRPTGVHSSHPDVQTLYHRYRGFRQDAEPLPSFAYFCYSVLEQSATPDRTMKSAGERYRISRNVLTEIKRLTSTKGGGQARKAGGATCPLSSAEREFLEHAVERLIRRVAEYHGRDGSVEALECITKGNIVP